MNVQENDKNSNYLCVCVCVCVLSVYNWLCSCKNASLSALCLLWGSWHMQLRAVQLKVCCVQNLLLFPVIKLHSDNIISIYCITIHRVDRWPVYHWSTCSHKQHTLILISTDNLNHQLAYCAWRKPETQGEHLKLHPERPQAQESNPEPSCWGNHCTTVLPWECHILSYFKEEVHFYHIFFHFLCGQPVVSVCRWPGSVSTLCLW